MKVSKFSISGNPFIGIYAKTNDRITLVGRGTYEQFLKFKSLETEIFPTTAGDLDIIGLYFLMNNSGILLPSIVNEKEYREIKDCCRGMEVAKVKTKFNALGNNVVANDKAAILNPKIKDKVLEKGIEDTLDVEVFQTQLDGFSTVGGIITATNNGFIAHPAIREKIKELEEVFRVRGGIGTANTGTPFPPISIIANSTGVLVGGLTTGYELHRILECLE